MSGAPAPAILRIDGDDGDDGDDESSHPDRLLGEVPILYAVPRAGSAPTADDLLAWCRDRLPRFKVPTQAHLLDSVPRTASGKIRRHLLAATPSRESTPRPIRDVDVEKPARPSWRAPSDPR